ncbi:hypothetical protein CF166_12650 [Amycolatopsis sp. KNN50.9b]|nr:hypothetical protein CF166_12650 [Amycolatopsis sp. KNN50.9b]
MVLPRRCTGDRLDDERVVGDALAGRVRREDGFGHFRATRSAAVKQGASRHDATAVMVVSGSAPVRMAAARGADRTHLGDEAGGPGRSERSAVVVIGSLPEGCEKSTTWRAEM